MTEFQTHICAACAAGLPEECLNPRVAIDPAAKRIDEFWIVPCSMDRMFLVSANPSKEPGQVGRPLLEPSEITDVLSTGRKRAAMVMPFLEGRICDWAHLKFAGGGVIPIVGCQGNTIAQAKTTEAAHEMGSDEVGHRHHGPDKNVLNNTPGVNLHGICTPCHTRWHAINDQFYDEAGRPKNASTPFLPVEAYFLHDNRTLFTDEEWELIEGWWELSVKDRGPYPFTPGDDVPKALPLSQGSATLDFDDNPFPESSPFTEIGDS